MMWWWRDGPEPVWWADSGDWRTKANFVRPILDREGRTDGERTWVVGLGKIGDPPYLIGYLQTDRTLYVYPAAHEAVKEAGEDFQSAIKELQSFAEAFAVLRS